MTAFIRLRVEGSHVQEYWDGFTWCKNPEFNFSVREALEEFEDACSDVEHNIQEYIGDATVEVVQDIVEGGDWVSSIVVLSKEFSA